MAQGPETLPQLTFLLIHHRMRQHLETCLQSIHEHTPASVRVATVVAHLKSPEDDGHWIRDRYPWVKLVFTERFGIAHMRNAALNAVEPESHVFVLDADARIRAGAIECAVQFIDDHPAAAATGPRTIRPTGELERNAKRFYTWVTVAVRRSPLNHLWPKNPWTRRHLMMDQDWDRPFECDWVAGAGMILLAEAVKALGGFEEAFTFGFEDVDWCYRAREAGWQVWYCPQAMIEHNVQRKSARGINRMTIEHLRSLWLFYRKHHGLNLKRADSKASGSSDSSYTTGQ